MNALKVSSNSRHIDEIALLLSIRDYPRDIKSSLWPWPRQYVTQIRRDSCRSLAVWTWLELCTRPPISLLKSTWNSHQTEPHFQAISQERRFYQNVNGWRNVSSIIQPDWTFVSHSWSTCQEADHKLPQKFLLPAYASAVIYQNRKLIRRLDNSMMRFVYC